MYIFNSTIDKYGRINIPYNFLKRLGNSFVVSKSFANEPCVEVHTAESLAEIETEQQPQAKRDSIMKQLHAENVKPKNGRFVIPKSLRVHAKIESDAVILCKPNSYEIWNEEELIKSMGTLPFYDNATQSLML